MPRFHFNVYDGIQWPDRDGRELESWEEARCEAIRYAGEILANGSKRIALGEDWRMEVTNETGTLLFRLDFTVMDAPAVMGSRNRPSNS